MRDLIAIAGEWSETSEATKCPDHDVRVYHSGAFVPLDRMPEGVERSLACGVAREQAKTGRPLDIVPLGKPGARLKANWNPSHERRLFAKSVRHMLRVLQSEERRFAGLLWLGQRDDDADREIFEMLVDRLRTALGVPELPVSALVIGSEGHDYTADVLFRNLARAAPSRKKTPGLDDHGAALMRGLPKAGRDAPWAGDRAVQWLWKGGMYEAWSSRPSKIVSDHCVIVFPHAGGSDTDGFAISGFGQRALEKRGIRAIFIRSRQSNWFQDDEILELADVIRANLPKKTRITTYGASMGAYGALLLSGRLDVERVVAIAPQYTLDRDAVPFERRWSVHRKRIGPFRHEMRGQVAPAARKIVLYDNLDKDRHHVALLEPDETYSLYRFPGASHQILRHLNETGALGTFLDMLTDPDQSFDAGHTLARAKRTKSPIYWLSIFRRTKTKRPRCAAAALWRCVDIEGEKPKYMKRFEKLPPEWRSRDTVSGKPRKIS